MTGSLLLGAGSALAAPSSDDVVEARCGQTVRAEPGQQVKVIPDLGLPIVRVVTRGMDPITATLGGILCRVQVTVVEPVTTRVAEAAPPLRQATEELREGTGAVLSPSARPRASLLPRSSVAPAAPAPAAPALTPQQAAAAAPAFAPAFSALPSSFLRSASGPAPGVAAYDPNMLLGSAFPGLRAGAPAYLGYDAASAVTTASQVQALPVDGLTGGGVGVPALIAVLVLSGVAAFAVRRIVLGTAGVGARTPAPAASEADDDTAGVAAPVAVTADEADEVDDDALTVAAIAAPAPADADELPTVVGRTPVPA
ncbi:hypothetical protein ACQPX6_30295 [Actinomycetospora sp. CA-101289]|uniref:hypothetical protein n=1 Tax=Actinomycetospora sp. CA-101289 TaxID=3239893 RepID=UPI003D97FCAB